MTLVERHGCLALREALLHGSMLSADFPLPHPMVTALGSYQAFRDWSSC